MKDENETCAVAIPPELLALARRPPTPAPTPLGMSNARLRPREARPPLVGARAVGETHYGDTSCGETQHGARSPGALGEGQPALDETAQGDTHFGAATVMGEADGAEVPLLPVASLPQAPSSDQRPRRSAPRSAPRRSPLLRRHFRPLCRRFKKINGPILGVALGAAVGVCGALAYSLQFEGDSGASEGPSGVPRSEARASQPPNKQPQTPLGASRLGPGAEVKSPAEAASSPSANSEAVSEKGVELQSEPEPEPEPENPADAAAQIAQLSRTALKEQLAGHCQGAQDAYRRLIQISELGGDKAERATWTALLLASERACSTSLEASE